MWRFTRVDRVRARASVSAARAGRASKPRPQGNAADRGRNGARPHVAAAGVARRASARAAVGRRPGDVELLRRARLSAGSDFPVLRLPAAAVPFTAGRVRPLAEERTLDKPITYDAVYGDRAGPGARAFPARRRLGQTWLDDGEHYLQFREGELYKVAARTGQATRFYDPQARGPRAGEAAGRFPRQTAQTLARGAWRTHEPAARRGAADPRERLVLRQARRRRRRAADARPPAKKSWRRSAPTASSSRSSAPTTCTSSMWPRRPSGR